MKHDNGISHGFNRLAPMLVAVLAIVLLGLFGCSEPPAQEPDAGTPDATDTQNVDTEPEDTGSDEDVDTGEPEPVDPCDDVNCNDDEICYYGDCHLTCDSILDCEGDDRCNAGRCAPTHCDDLDCPEASECFRGRCYDSCTQNRDCGIGTGITCEDGACVPLTDQCEGLECDEVTCGAGETTTVTGTVTIPSGDYPLPNVTVYVPTEDLNPLPEGASCSTCDELLSGEPLLQNITDIEGKFVLPNFPVADDVPLVIQTGKWRREVEVSDIDPCTTNELDAELTRLPRNQSEGNIPKIAIVTGSCDVMECFIRDIGLDDSEFTPEDDGGSVNIFYGGGGTSGFDSGESFTDAEGWWDDGTNLLDYDILLDSCECSDTGALNRRSEMARVLNFPHFLNSGGRAFMSHYQYVWLRDGSDELQAIAEWDGPFGGGTQPNQVDVSHDGGQEMADWLSLPAVGASIGSNNQITISDARRHVSWVDEALTTTWLFYPDESWDRPNYFSFNMPLGTEGDDACGRGVFANLHVSGSGGFGDFPSTCSGGAMSDQEKALVYMLFDLSACIAPECEPVECSDDGGKYQCGIHADTCGGIIECGECCDGLGQECSSDGDCCQPLVCDDGTGVCTDD